MAAMRQRVGFTSDGVMIDITQINVHRPSHSSDGRAKILILQEMATESL
jgi:hypothetical protein